MNSYVYKINILDERKDTEILQNVFLATNN